MPPVPAWLWRMRGWFALHCDVELASEESSNGFNCCHHYRRYCRNCLHRLLSRFEGEGVGFVKQPLSLSLFFFGSPPIPSQELSLNLIRDGRTIIILSGEGVGQLSQKNSCIAKTAVERKIYLLNWRQFFMRLSSCYWWWISSQHCQSTCGSTRRWCTDYFDNVMTKLIVNNRTDALKTDINFFFYGSVDNNCSDDNKLSNCLFSLVDASRKLQFHLSVRLLTVKINQWARENFCSYRKKVLSAIQFLCLTLKKILAQAVAHPK